MSDNNNIARVITHFGHEILISSYQGKRLRATVRKDVPALVSGDKVHWHLTENNDAVITELLERHGLLTRSTRFANSKPIAANIDLALVVCSHHPELRTGLIDRYLAACELAKIDAAIVFNKVDLLTDKELHEIKQQLSIYETIPYPVFYISAKQEDTLNDLKNTLKDKSSILVGQSGVGKSSIIRGLHPTANPKVADVSDKTNKGRHTTTHSELYNLNDNSFIIDSPGIREFGLDLDDPALLESGFKEFQALLGQCQFRDCMHISEPKCAIQKAVKAGSVSPQRWESYKSILDSLGEG